MRVATIDDTVTIRPGDCFRDRSRRGYERILRVERISITNAPAYAAVCSIHIRHPDDTVYTRTTALARVLVAGLASQQRYDRVADVLAGTEA
jgi:hypothetical protein